MRFLINVLLISMVLMTTVIVLGVCKKNTTEVLYPEVQKKTSIYIYTGPITRNFSRGNAHFINSPRRMYHCPEGQKRDNYGECRVAI
ncbi:hypothetical protein PUN28_015127 [Cardiocondyla obscurior]|uniref:Uncharacterized protein n=1 Tax=Cardiocondyla obscurior TaxID=286306 RepID=A0AAW2F114_9HYME